MKLKQAIKDVIEMKDMTQETAYTVATDIMSGHVTDAQLASLLTALTIKGESIDEITGFVLAMREKATPVECGSRNIIDTCGTGGDAKGTFNISTISAFVAAGAGCHVAKHGNRSVSSNCGSADLLENMDINIDLQPEKMAECIDKIGIGFLFAPALHQAMKHAVGPRRQIGIRTIFNILGPLTNPAGTKRQLLGVFKKELTEPIARVLGKLGCKHCMVVHGEDGLDEITTTGRTYISEYKKGKVNNYFIQPENFGFRKSSIEDIMGGNIQDNVRIAHSILEGADGFKREIVLLNAGAAIYVGGRAGSIEEGIKMAENSIDTGKAIERYLMLKELTN